MKEVRYVKMVTMMLIENAAGKLNIVDSEAVQSLVKEAKENGGWSTQDLQLSFVEVTYRLIPWRIQ